MAINWGALAQPKGEPRKRTKARRKRQEHQVAVDVRARVAERDGACRLLENRTDILRRDFGPCSGVSEWAHMGGAHRRFQTRGLSPEERHSSQGSLMLCTGHHLAYDAHVFDIRPLDPDLGADWSVCFEPRMLV